MTGNKDNNIPNAPDRMQSQGKASPVISMKGHGSASPDKSDLSHYRPYADARAMDADTVRRILALQWPLPERRACGAVGVNGMVVVARARGLRPVLVDARNSGDTAGDRARVVGYATVRFEEVRSDQG